MTKDEIRNFILQKRIALELTQTDLALLSGVAQATISKIERHGTSLSVETLCKILRAMGLKITFEYL